MANEPTVTLTTMNDYEKLKAIAYKGETWLTQYGENVDMFDNQHSPEEMVRLLTVEVDTAFRVINDFVHYMRTAQSKEESNTP